MAIFINGQRNLNPTIIPISNLDFSTLLQKLNIPPQFWMNGVDIILKQIQSDMYTLQGQPITRWFVFPQEKYTKSNLSMESNPRYINLHTNVLELPKEQAKHLDKKNLRTNLLGHLTI